MLWLLGTYLLISAISAAAFVILIIALPSTYFCEKPRPGVERHPVVRWIGFVAKNLLGLAIVALGVLLSLPGIPGQGILTIAVGVALLDFPGKQRWTRAVMGRPAVLRRVNALRRMFGRAPLEVAS